MSTFSFLHTKHTHIDDSKQINSLDLYLIDHLITEFHHKKHNIKTNIF